MVGLVAAPKTEIQLIVAYSLGGADADNEAMNRGNAGELFGISLEVFSLC